jgi:sulfite exporter TauE/SafE/copper chaperone CopZ
MENMEAKIRVRKLRIEGMTCVNCQNRIEKTLRSTAGVEDAEVSYTAGTAVVAYNTETITIQEITSIIESLDYRVRTGEAPPGNASYRTAGVLIAILALFMLIQHFGLAGLFNAFPLAEAGMGYGMLLVIGLVTSVHCVAMCGGINLSQCLPGGGLSTEGGLAGGKAAALRPSLLYNLGRLISYTVVGVLVGALGSVISFSGMMKGVVQVAAGIFMVVMGINMLGLLPGLRKFIPRMPRIFARRVDQAKAAHNSPLYVGLLNGLMPCGPLQAMQLYALSTGSPLRGGLSMMIFCLGTIPLMFGLGALSAVLSKRFTKNVMTAGAALVVVLGLTMFSNGWSLSGFPGLASLPGLFMPGPAAAAGGGSILVENGVQVVNTTLASGRYAPITVQAGLPVRWIIDAPQGSINGCNNRMIIPEYGIEHQFSPGANVIEFTPGKTGVFRYSCWMGMIRSTITVIEPGTTVTASAGADESWDEPWFDEPSEPVPAGFRLPTRELAIAEIGGGVQQVRIDLSDTGFSPAVVVIQAGLAAEWTINNISTREENFELLFPAYGQKLPFYAGEGTISLYPQGDFEFSTSDSEYYGLVKVVEYLDTMDIDAVKAGAGNYETLIYPSSYFGPAAGAQGCCF